MYCFKEEKMILTIYLILLLLSSGLVMKIFGFIIGITFMIIIIFLTLLLIISIKKMVEETAYL